MQVDDFKVKKLIRSRLGRSAKVYKMRKMHENGSFEGTPGIEVAEAAACNNCYAAMCHMAA